MGRRWGKLMGGMLASVALLLAAAPAPSAEHESGANSEGNGFGSFTLRGSNGYRIYVLAIFQPGYGESSRVLISAGRKDGSVFYAAPALVTNTRIDADLGELGRIALEFKPTGAKGIARPSCAPEEGLAYDKGSYVGEFEFRGEEGFTTVDATRVTHSPRLLIELLCGTSGIGEIFGHGIPGARLTAHTRLGQGRVRLQVNQNDANASVRVEAEVVERRGRIQISRDVRRAYPATAFDFAPKLAFASFTPEAPFSGKGVFRRGAKRSNRWTGNLAIDFPGRSNVPLTGDRFRVKLLHARLTEDQVREGGIRRPNLSAWPSTKPSPTEFVTSSPRGPS